MDDRRRLRFARTKERLKEAGMFKKGKYVKLICPICKRVENRHVNDRSIYTEEYKKAYKCWRCK